MLSASRFGTAESPSSSLARRLNSAFESTRLAIVPAAGPSDSKEQLTQLETAERGTGDGQAPHTCTEQGPARTTGTRQNKHNKNQKKFYSPSELCAQHCLQWGRPISSSTTSVLKHLSDSLRPHKSLSSPLATCKQPLTTRMYDTHQCGMRARAHLPAHRHR